MASFEHIPESPAMSSRVPSADWRFDVTVSAFVRLSSHLVATSRSNWVRITSEIHPIFETDNSSNHDPLKFAECNLFILFASFSSFNIPMKHFICFAIYSVRSLRDNDSELFEPDSPTGRNVLAWRSNIVSNPWTTTSLRSNVILTVLQQECELICDLSLSPLLHHIYLSFQFIWHRWIPFIDVNVNSQQSSHRRRTADQSAQLILSWKLEWSNSSGREYSNSPSEPPVHHQKTFALSQDSPSPKSLMGEILNQIGWMMEVEWDSHDEHIKLRQWIPHSNSHLSDDNKLPLVELSFLDSLNVGERTLFEHQEGIQIYGHLWWVKPIIHGNPDHARRSPQTRIQDWFKNSCGRVDWWIINLMLKFENWMFFSIFGTTNIKIRSWISSIWWISCDIILACIFSHLPFDAMMYKLGRKPWDCDTIGRMKSLIILILILRVIKSSSLSQHVRDNQKVELAFKIVRISNVELTREGCLWRGK
jgi:hypothetical protein